MFIVVIMSWFFGLFGIALLVMSFVFSPRLRLLSNGNAEKRPARRAVIPVRAAVKARWSFDAKFGCKEAALQLMASFVKRVSENFPPLGKAEITHGAIGVSESNIELEMQLDNLQGMDGFWSQIPADFQKEWANHLRPLIVDGSTRWTVHHILPDTERDASKLVESLTQIFVPDSSTTEGQKSGEKSQKEESDKGDPKVEPSSNLNRVVRDWKGDPMIINPGDKLPFKFM